MSIPSFKRLAGPVALTNTLTTNLYNPATGLFAILRAVHVVNKTASPHNFSIWLGATGGNAAGTEEWNAQNVPANSVYDWYGMMELGASAFLVGGADANTALTITLSGEEYVIPPAS
jgi:hypothetical protein